MYGQLEEKSPQYINSSTNVAHTDKILGATGEIMRRLNEIVEVLYNASTQQATLLNKLIGEPVGGSKLESEKTTPKRVGIFVEIETRLQGVEYLASQIYQNQDRLNQIL